MAKIMKNAVSSHISTQSSSSVNYDEMKKIRKTGWRGEKHKNSFSYACASQKREQLMSNVLGFEASC